MTVKIYPFRNDPGELADRPLQYYRCDTEAERDALTDLLEGDQSYARDTDTFAIWDGAAWDESGGSGGGVTDHGALTGLADDDHPQYQKESEKGAANGYASLDSGGFVPDAQIPAAIARDSEVSAAIAAVINSAPGALDTLDELAAALGDDANFAATMTTALAAKVAKSLFDANTIIKADTDDTPVALSVAEQTLVGRITGGNIDDLSAAQVKTLLAIAVADLTNHTKAVHDALGLSHDSLSDVSEDDHHAKVHGATEHTDVTRSLWVPARPGMVPDGGAASAIGAVPNSTGTITLADASTQGAAFSIQMPADAKAASPVSLQIWWAPLATVAGSSKVEWEINAGKLVNGSLVNLASTATQFTGVNQSQVASTLVVEAIQQILASVSAGDLIRIEIRRLGSNGNDNLTTTAHLVGAHLEYTAVQ